MRAVAERSGIDLTRSFAYTDSITDLPLLSAVGNPVAVNPDQDLRKVAEERDWPIKDFHRPSGSARGSCPPFPRPERVSPQRWRRLASRPC